MRQKLLSYTLIFALVYGTTPYSFAAGAVIVDNTINGALDNETLIPDASNTFNITEDKGLRADTNLFHSFLQFDIEQLETALFSQNLGETTNNVISRVTGLAPSMIDGTISNIPDANFWFVNTSGVIIGANAAFDVSGSLSIGAVDFVEFAGGGRFYALPEPGEDLSVLNVNPVDFGFLGTPTTGSLTITGMTLDDTAAGSSVGDIKLAGGSVSITNSTIINKPESSGDAITVSGGSIELDSTRLETRANAFAADDVNITATAGDVFIHNGTFIVSQASSTGGETGATGSIQITASDDVRVNVNDAGVDLAEFLVQIESSASNDASASGDVTIQGTNVLLNDLTIRSVPSTTTPPATNATISVLATGADPGTGFVGGILRATDTVFDALVAGGVVVLGTDRMVRSFSRTLVP